MTDRDRRGFTLIEMLIVVVILAILAAIAWGRFNRPSLTTIVAPDSVVAPQAAGQFVVRVENSIGRPQRGVPVVFRVVEGNATIGPEVVQTDSTGTATATWVAGSVAGLNAFSARVGDSEWGGAQTTVTVRVDPARGAAPAPAPAPAQAAPRDSAPVRSDTGSAAGGTPPASGTAGDSGAVQPPEESEVDTDADTAAARIPLSTTPLWAARVAKDLIAED